MALKGIGKYSVKGVHGTVQMAGTVTLAAADSKPTGFDDDFDFDLATLRDGKGAVVAVAADDPTATLTVRLTPIDSTSPGALATAKSNVKLPKRLEKVTLAGLGNDLDGDWHFLGGGRSYSEGWVQVTLRLGRWGDPPAYLGDVMTIE